MNILFVVLFILGHQSAAITNFGQDVRSRFVQRIGANPGGVAFDILSGYYVYPSSAETGASAADYINAVLSTFFSPDPPYSFDVARSTRAFTDTPYSNAFSAYVAKWGNGVGGVMYGALNANISYTIYAPAQFLAVTMSQWLNDHVNGVDDSGDPLLSSTIPSIKLLVNAFGTEIGGLLYGSFVAIYAKYSLAMADQPFSLAPNLEGLLNDALQNNAGANPDVFGYADTSQEDDITWCLIALLGPQAATFVGGIVNGGPPGLGQMDSVNYLVQLLIAYIPRTGKHAM